MEPRISSPAPERISTPTTLQEVEYLRIPKGQIITMPTVIQLSQQMAIFTETTRNQQTTIKEIKEQLNNLDYSNHKTRSELRHLNDNIVILNANITKFNETMLLVANNLFVIIDRMDKKTILEANMNIESEAKN